MTDLTTYRPVNVRSQTENNTYTNVSTGLETPIVPHIVVPVADPDDPAYIVEPGASIKGVNLDGVVNISSLQGTGSGVLLSTGKHILTAAHVVDSAQSAGELTVSFDLAGGRQSFSVAEMDIHPDWASSVGYDLAVLELNDAVPVQGFDIYRGQAEIGQDFHLVGYGREGTGQTGVVSSDPDAGLTKRWGMNTFDTFNTGSLSQVGDAPNSSLLVYDFDDGTSGNDLLGDLLGQPHLGLGEAEVMAAPGDSGGPAFMTAADGTWQVSGLVQGGSGDSSFGNTLAFDTRLSYYQDWIDSVVNASDDSPEPAPAETNVFTLYDSGSMSADDLVNAMIGDISGISLVSGSANYIGADDAASTFSELDFGGAATMNNGGIMLTSGDGAPPLTNTSGSYGKGQGTPGDAQLDEIAQSAFDGAGSTNDASILEFSFTVSDPAVEAISFDLIFGSDEYPEFADTSYVDIAAILVNDTNYGLFDGDNARPLSVTGANVSDGNLLDNSAGSYSIEYDGISPRLTINVPLDGSDVYDVRLGISDTGDSAYDSGLMVSNFQTSTSGAGGLLVNVTAPAEGGELMPAGPNTATKFEGGIGDDIMNGSTAKDIYDISAGGSNTIQGNAQQLNGDTVEGFGENDTLKLQGSALDEDDVTITMGSAILDMDTDNDGVIDTTVTLEGDFSDAQFLIEQVGNDTVITQKADTTQPPTDGVPTDDDVILPQRGIVSAGSGDDDYLFSNNVIGSGEDITLTDTQGNNTVHFLENFTVESFMVRDNALKFVLSNASEITILSADQFSFVSEGNLLSGTEGTPQTFASFVENQLGVEVPAEGMVTAGGEVVFNPVAFSVNGVEDKGALEIA